MSFIDKAITNILPHLPKWFAKPFAKPYVAGETINEALNHIKTLNDKGLCATLDILGEHILKPEQAKKIAMEYCLLYDMISGNNLDCNISIKPTHIGLSISYDHVISNAETILDSAKKNNNFLRLDMESSEHTDQTIQMYKYCKSIYDKVGMVVQSYLHRSKNDIKDLANNNFNSRICKGIYKEPRSLAFQNPIDINNNFLELAKLMAKESAYSGYATHDQDLIDKLLNWIKNNKISKNLFEFQVLFGVPMQGRLDSLIKQGYKVRVYVPFGPDWFDYSIRRLKENPSIAAYVLKNFFKSDI